MKTGISERHRRIEGLGFRLAMMLSIALIPLGVIAVAQTSRVVEHAEEIAQTALSGRTEAAATAARTLIRTALATGQALGLAFLDSGIGDSECSQMLRHFAGTTPYVSYLGFVGQDGIVRCASDGESRDFAGNGFFKRLVESNAPVVTTSQRVIPGTASLVVAQPVVDDGRTPGYILMSIVPAPLDGGMDSGDAEMPFSIVTFNHDGELLNATEDLNDAARLLPVARPLGQLADESNGVFRDTAADGSQRLYAVATILPGIAYTLGSVAPSSSLDGSSLLPAGALLFPLVMWLASLGVAYFAVQRLVLRHVSELRGQMRRFAQGERDVAPEVLTDAPTEIRDVSQTFHNLAKVLIREERELADSLKEKTVLLREIHHRVKNNLQLIASIMNMQMRQVHEPDARRVLKSVQDRVASLATIHRNLYQAEMLVSVRADKLLGDIVNQMAILSSVPGRDVLVDTDFDPIALNPDQAVPVSLLTTEALTNAIKYATPDTLTGKCGVRLSLKDLGKGMARLRIVNSTGSVDAGMPVKESGTGLGTQLIGAFGQQLNSEVVQGQTDQGYEVSVLFHVEPAPTEIGNVSAQ